MLHILVVKRKMNTIKQPSKGIMLAKGPSASRNSLKIITQEMLLKTFLTSTCITTQSRCTSKRVLMPKRVVSQPLGVETLNYGGRSVPKMAFKVIGQWSD
jgi:hypothetical protein